METEEMESTYPVGRLEEKIGKNGVQERS